MSEQSRVEELAEEAYCATENVYEAILRLQDAIFAHTQRFPRMRIEVCANGFDGLFALLEASHKMKPVPPKPIKIVLGAMPGEVEFVRGDR